MNVTVQFPLNRLDVIRDGIQSFLGQPGMSLYVVATGAGAGIQDWIWSIPGCSTFFKGAIFPYSTDDSAYFAGVKPEKYASDEFAIDLALAAYLRAISNPLDPNAKPVGLAVTASVASNREHRGEHRIHIACVTRHRMLGRTVILKKGVGAVSRLDDGHESDLLALEALIAAMDPGHALNEDCLDIEDKVREHFFKHPVFYAGKRMTAADLSPEWPLLPGAFDPPHTGHESMADAVLAHEKREPIFTICCNPPHKPSITVQEMLRRAKMLPNHAVFFTQDDPLYIDKARAYPGRPIVIGADAVLRLMDPQWCQDPKALYDELQKLRTQFLVFGRIVNGEYMTAGHAIWKVYETLGFVEQTSVGKQVTKNKIGIEVFRPVAGRWDVSSTDLRGRSGPVQERNRST
jgi:hypothetical protein